MVTKSKVLRWFTAGCILAWAIHTLWVRVPFTWPKDPYQVPQSPYVSVSTYNNQGETAILSTWLTEILYVWHTGD